MYGMFAALQLALGLAGDRDLRVGENRVRLRQPVVGAFGTAGRRIAPGDLALLDRDVHEQVHPGHVADGEDVRVRRAQRLVDRDPGDLVVADVRRFEVQTVDGRDAAERVEDLVRRDGLLDAVAHEVHDLHPVLAHADALHLRARLDAHPLFAQIFGEPDADVVVGAGEQVRGAENHRHRDAGAMEELAELAPDVPAAEDDQRRRGRLEIERRVAVDEAGLGEAGERGRRDAAARRDDEAPALEQLVADAQRGRRREPRLAVIDRERVDPGDPVVGPVADEPPLSRGERAHSRARDCPASIASSRGLAKRVQQIAGRDQRLRGHAAAQDAEPAERTAVDQRDLGALFAGGARRRVPAAPGADDDHVVPIRNLLLLGARPQGLAIYGRARRFHAGDRRRPRGTSGTVNLAAVRSTGRTAFGPPSAVGRPAVAAVGLAGLTVGFFLWYGAALRGPHGPLYLDATLPLALLAGLVIAYGGWLGYGRYVARRARIDEATALQYDAISWASLVVLWGTLLPPNASAGTERAAAIAVALFVVSKLAIAARFNRTVRDVIVTFIVTRLPLIAIAELGLDGDRAASGRALCRLGEPAARGLGALGRRALSRDRGARLLGLRARVLPALSGADPRRHAAHRIAPDRRADRVEHGQLLRAALPLQARRARVQPASRAAGGLLRLDLSDGDLLLGGLQRIAVPVPDRRVVLLRARAGVDQSRHLRLLRGADALRRGAARRPALHRVARRIQGRRPRVRALLVRRHRQAAHRDGARPARDGRVHGISVGAERRSAALQPRADALGPPRRMAVGQRLEHRARRSRTRTRRRRSPTKASSCSSRR